MSDSEFGAALPTMLPRLWRFGLRLARDKHDAEDLVQRTCVRALERQSQLQPGTAMLSWLFSIMHSIWLNELRARQIRARSSVSWDGATVETIRDPNGRDPETETLYRQVIEAVEALPDAQRTVMLLITAEGLTYREVADILDIPIGTVMSRLARARLTIGKQFEARTNSPRTNNGESIA